jgi:hypothetical protein
MSHHFDTPTAIEDGRINLCDLYAFPESPGISTLILTVNPDAGRSSPTTFRPDALYEFVIASDGGTVEDRAFRMTFAEPAPGGRQQMTVSHAEGEQSRGGFDGSPLGTCQTAAITPLSNGGAAWFGVAGDPFWADGLALFQFHSALAAGDYRPEVMGAAPSNIFTGRNVSAIALQLPNAAFGGDEVALWARISLYGHAPQQRVSRMGNPMLRPLFFPTPGPEAEELNAGSPATDLERHGARLRQLAEQIATLRNLPKPDEHAASVAHAFLPDVLRFRPGQPAHHQPGTGNGRGLQDDAFGTAVSVLNGGPLGHTESPHPLVPEFPHVPPANNDDMPALVDLFGLRALAPHSDTVAPTQDG